MADYQEKPTASTTPYALFLIRKPAALTEEVIGRLYTQLKPSGRLISVERLFKGTRQAVVVFGPADILQPFSKELELLELMDYSIAEDAGTLAWEMGVKKLPQAPFLVNNFIAAIPKLLETEEFWWQLVLKPSKEHRFYTVIRVVVRTKELKRTQTLKSDFLKTISQTGLLELPTGYLRKQLLQFCRERTQPNVLRETPGDKLKLTPPEIRSILGVSL